MLKVGEVSYSVVDRCQGKAKRSTLAIEVVVIYMAEWWGPVPKSREGSRSFESGYK